MITLEVPFYFLKKWQITSGFSPSRKFIKKSMSGTKHHAALAASKGALPVVGLGASAGGLEALKAFFSAVPARCDMAFIVVTHRDPDSVNLLPEILEKHTTLSVVEVENGAEVRPGHVYISPASDYLQLRKGRLVFEKMIRDGVRLPIDFFFRSLAGELGEKAVCILLSGSGSDGTLGLQTVKGEGGMAMAQSLGTAQFSDMPRNAIATGMVDYILPPEQMPGQLIRYVHDRKRGEDNEAQPLIQNAALDDILHLIRQHIGSDFSLYKTNTLVRRIERRMNVHHIADPREYVGYLQENTHEVALLFKELLIGVTSFFRDSAAFEALENEALPELLAGKSSGDTVRLWSAGCSTGEEPYSFAILLQEYMEREKKSLNVQIFATDLDDNAVNLARTGLYSDGIALDIPEERLNRHFIKEDNHYRIRKNIREMVIFATQNLIQDPPFTKLDFISCRNLLIYLDARTQKKIIPLFHYALRPGGILFLGSSETIGTFTELFAPLHTRGKIFTRKEAPLSGRHLAQLMELPRTGDAGYKTGEAIAMPKGKTPDISELAQKILLTQHIPPSLIVNDKGDIFFIHGRTGQYLEPSPGQPQPHQNALSMAREGLQLALASIIRKAAAQDAEIVQRGIRIRVDGHFSALTLRARKIGEPEALRGLIWITFEKEEDNAAAVPPETAQIENTQLERELQFIKQSLQSTIEEREAANEHLKSANEEMQSTNEELQSANEELETAKEEMQSLNEELQTVNAELENKISDLSHANDDMTNLLNNTGIATVFLDNNLNVKRFTAPAKKIIHLIPADVGRPVSDIVSQLEYTDLVKDAAGVLETLVHKEREVRARDWSWYLMRIMPYRTAQNVIDGLVITFVDITRLKKSEILLATNIRALEMISLKKAPLESVLDEVLRMIERQTQGIRCAVSLLDEKSGHLRRAAGPSLPAGFNDAMREVKTSGTEPCAIAVREQKHVIVADLSESSALGTFAALALKYDIQSVWTQPIYSAKRRVLGAFTIYYNHPHKPFPMEEELINEAVPLMGMALSRNEMENKK
jgi:two-component system CheB/CheR fusion protein